MSLENLKLSKQLVMAMSEAGYSAPKELQEKTLSRILGGQEIIAVGPEGSGKTTALVLGVLMRLKCNMNEPPRALILVPSKEKVLELVEQFKLLGAYTDLKTIGLAAGISAEGQKEALDKGLDVVIGTPDRVYAMYLKSGLNIKRVKMFIVDDGELIVKQGLQTLVHQIAEIISKCQHLVFTEVIHDKLTRMVDFFMINPTVIEVNESVEKKLETIDQVLYMVPNYRTKQNLLNLMMIDGDVFRKVVVFVNTRLTAANLYKSLNKRIPEEVAMLNPLTYEQKGIDSFKEFRNLPEIRVLLVANEDKQAIDLKEVSYILHFDLPAEKEVFIERVEKRTMDEEEQPLSITFSTDIELALVKKIEQSTGQPMQLEDLPPGLVVEGNRKRKVNNEDEVVSDESKLGSAFHEKKESNAKDYNWGWKVKNKLFGKKYKNKK